MGGKRVLIVLTMMFLAVTCVGCGSDLNDKKDQAKPTAEPEKETVVGKDLTQDDIVVLFTTDVHHKLTDYIGYDGVAAYKKDIEAICREDRVFLVDSGDCLDSGALGDATSGAAIAEIMNEVGYDVAVPGNHDFKYGVDNLKQLASDVDYRYLCCNLREKSSASNVLEAYAIFETGDKKLAFIGATTSAGTFTYEGANEFAAELTEDGYVKNPRYDFWEEALYERVQQVVDEVRAKGADYVILTSHLGYDASSCSSTDLIKNTTGIDAVIDGHAHVEIAMEQIENAEGRKIVLASAGCFLMNIGELVINREGDISTRLVPMADYMKKDEKTTKFIESLESVER